MNKGIEDPPVIDTKIPRKSHVIRAFPGNLACYGGMGKMAVVVAKMVAFSNVTLGFVGEWMHI